jgi:hypothetical protein
MSRPRGNHAADAAPVRRPVAWRITPAEIARFTAEGEHCETRRCPKPVAIVTWRWFRSRWAGRVLIAEHFTCEEHGQAFAQRHHITVEPAADGDAQ